jgi:hypothetical protein
MLDKDSRTERRAGERRVTNDPDYAGPERRVADRRATPPAQS